MFAVRRRAFCLAACLAGAVVSASGLGKGIQQTTQPGEVRSSSYGYTIVPSVKLEAKAERASLMSWIDSLGIKAIATGRFVEIRDWSQDGTKRKLTGLKFAFVEAGAGQEVDYVDTSLKHGSTRKVSDTKPRYWTTEVVPADLSMLASRIKGLPTATASERYDAGPTRDLRALRGQDEVVLARAAELRNLRQVADWFFEDAKLATAGQPLNMLDRTKGELGWRLLNDAIRDCGSDKPPRPKLLSEMQFIVEHFPESDFRRVASGYASILKEMVGEDATHKPLTDAELARLSPAGQAKELVWQLRDQNGHQYTHPGFPDIFAAGGLWTYVPEGKSPAHKLVKLHLAAVPALIDALDDRRLTRTVPLGTDGEFKVLEFRDAALQILAQISGRNFGIYWKDESLDPDRAKKANTKNTADVLEWWASVGKNGEETTLIQDLLKNEYWLSPNAAAILCVKYPKTALKAIKEAVSSGPTKIYFDFPGENLTRPRGDPEIPNETLARIIYELRLLKGDATRAYVNEQMTKGAFAQLRLSAAEVMSGYDTDLAAKTMANEWHQQSIRHDRYFPESEVIRFLVGTQREVALDALFAHAKSYKTYTLNEIFSAVRFPSYDYPNDVRMNPPGEKVRERARLKIEDFLASQLTNLDRIYGTSGGSADDRYENPRICDEAAFKLAEIWPKKYPFMLSRSQSDLDSVRLRMLNVWRRSRSMPLLSRLPEVRWEGVDAKKLNAAMQGLLAGSEDPSQFFALGPAAWNPLNEAIPTLSGIDRFHAERIANQLANLVVDVHFKGAHLDNTTTANTAGGLKGNPLDFAKFESLVKRLVELRSKVKTRIQLVAEKLEGVAGYDLSIEIGGGSSDSDGWDSVDAEYNSGSNSHGAHLERGFDSYDRDVLEPLLTTDLWAKRKITITLH